jgi:hypothetical protein
VGILDVAAVCGVAPSAFVFVYSTRSYRPFNVQSNSIRMIKSIFSFVSVPFIYNSQPQLPISLSILEILRDSITLSGRSVIEDEVD